MSAAFIVAARRTAVAPRDGALRAVEVADLAAAPMRAVLADAGIAPRDVEEVILGNALYGGGNPARLAALAAGLPEDAPALTIDTQCCAGLDAVMLAADRVAAGARAIIACGVESFSRAPIRLHRPRHPDEAPREYSRPPFTPWSERDPDMIPAAAALARSLGISRHAQEIFAVESHRKALQHGAAAQDTVNHEIVAVAGLARDAFARTLTAALCARLPALAGDPDHAVTTATVAVEADAAAAVLVVDGDLAARLQTAGHPIRIVGSARRGGDPTLPGLAPIAAARAVLARHGIPLDRVDVAEIMEAFAAQAIACMDGIGLDPARVNRGGGALARGHPIGASGAILAVRLWHELAPERDGATGLAAIAAAGGLGSAIVMRR